MSSSDIAVSIRNLSKAYTIAHDLEKHTTLAETIISRLKNPLRRARTETFWALKDVSFDIKKGEVVGIIGRNGAGKSTLLKILSRITEPTTGEVELFGRVGSLLEVGTGFHPELTGRENVYLNGAILGMAKSEIKKQFDAIVDFAGVEQFLDTPVKRYSSGMYVRLAFAVAAHLNPEILIVDEVLAVGDANFQKKCLGKMQDVSTKEGRTILFVSHNMGAVLQLCTRGLLLKAGTINQEGDVTSVVGAYFGDSIVSTSGEYDLATHSARSSKNRPIIRKIRLYNENNTIGTQLTPEEHCSIEIDYEAPEKIAMPRWAIAIEDNLGRRLMTFASYFAHNDVAPISGTGTVRCSIDSLGLGPGQYLLSVSIGDKQSGLIDSLDRVARFEVRWNNNFDNGEQYHQVYGPILRASKWETAYSG